MEQLAGRYRSDLYGEAIVTVAGDGLHFRIVDGAEGELRHWQQDTFRLYLDATNPGGYFATFESDPSGATRAAQHHGTRDIPAGSLKGSFAPKGRENTNLPATP